MAYGVKNILLLSALLLGMLAGCTPAKQISSRENIPGEVFSSRLTAGELHAAPVKLIPYPLELRWLEGRTSLQSLQIENAQDLPENLAAELMVLAGSFGFDLAPNGNTTFVFNKNEELPQEGYYLDVQRNQIYLEAATEAGAFYGLQTLRQLIVDEGNNPGIPNCTVSDYPKFPIRGFMLDVGRNFQTLTSLKKQLEIMARYKLNTFHWHLTDNPAWRIESHRFPELNSAENHYPSRDPGQFYTYDEIRELIEFARQRAIQIIPEIDMPGHSECFVTATGVKMESPEGMLILEHILNEFFEEIPVDLCPFIHLGSDEVRIPNPEEFINKMVAVCQKNNRKVLIWNPGLPANPQVIRQTWQAQHLEAANYPEIDSWNSYTNNGEPLTLVSRLFFKPIGYGSENDILGGIQCLWPDVDLVREEDAFVLNPHYPALLTYAWACWTADVSQPPADYLTLLPGKESQAAAHFEAFENYLLDHKNRYFSKEPFPYFYQSNREWKIALGKINSKESDLQWKAARGNTLTFKDRFALGGYFPDAKPGACAFAETIVESETEKEIEVLIGFETPLRANRVYSGIPPNGSWDANGGQIWINGEELKGPTWNNPGWKPSKQSGWSMPDQETPWTEEELYWTRKPATIQLKKGKNRIRVKAPYVSDYQNWMVTLVFDQGKRQKAEGKR